MEIGKTYKHINGKDAMFRVLNLDFVGQSKTFYMGEWLSVSGKPISTDAFWVKHENLKNWIEVPENE